SPEERMLGHGQLDVKIARRAASGPRFALPGEPQLISRLDSGGNADRDLLLRLDAACAPAVRAGLRDHAATSSAFSARARDGQEPQLVPDLPRAPAGAARLDR